MQEPDRYCRPNKRIIVTDLTDKLFRSSLPPRHPVPDAIIDRTGYVAGLFHHSAK